MLSEGIVRQCVVHICLIVSGKLICFEHFRDKIDSYIDRMPQGLSWKLPFIHRAKIFPSFRATSDSYSPPLVAAWAKWIQFNSHSVFVEDNF